MKRSSLSCIAGALAVGFLLMPCVALSLGQTGHGLAAIPADHALIQALASRDKPALNELLDPEFTWIDANGQSLARGQVLESLPKIANANVEPQLRSYDNMAVLRASRDRLHVLRIWVHRQSGWRILLYQEVQQVEKSESPNSARAAADGCENPCQSIPFVPETQSEKEAIASWQAVMRAMADNDADAYAPLIADEFTATDTHHDRPYTKSDRLAQIKKLKLAGAPARPPELTSARMFDFGETVMMMAREQRPNAKSYFNTRMWVKREGHWQMLFSFNTRIE
ncbi:MAG TPA: nuclear transport factor 2 family protein [Candidatus Sulfotelmatobacter sp.]|nr:nuclear transport factor 2 family protein [Candidatus Sulfotelmatobacter sp.]